MGRSDESGERVKLEMRDGIAEVALDRPGKMNALDLPMFVELARVGDRLAADPDLRAVVLSGAGRAFCAGLDLESFGSADLGSMFLARTHGPANLFQHAALVWRSLAVPVIAAVHGVAFGGGFQIMLGADIRYATAEAKFSVMEIKWGIVPDMGGTLLMPELARADVVRELTYTGRVFAGPEAASLGFVTRLEADPHKAALATAAEIAGRSPDAVRAAKRLFTGEWDVATRLARESAEQGALLGSRNQREAVRANLEGRKPSFHPPGGASIGESA